jgi:hypothetical protein
MIFTATAPACNVVAIFLPFFHKCCRISACFYHKHDVQYRPLARKEVAMFELIIGLIIATILYFVIVQPWRAVKTTVNTSGKPEFKYNSWYGSVMIRKGSYDEIFFKALSAAYIVAFFALLSPVVFFAFVILFGIISSVLPGEIALFVSLFLFVATIGRVIYVAWKSMTTFYDFERVDSFSMCSCSESSCTICSFFSDSDVKMSFTSHR